MRVLQPWSSRKYLPASEHAHFERDPWLSVPACSCAFCCLRASSVVWRHRRWVLRRFRHHRSTGDLSKHGRCSNSAARALNLDKHRRAWCDDVLKIVAHQIVALKRVARCNRNTRCICKIRYEISSEFGNRSVVCLCSWEIASWCLAIKRFAVRPPLGVIERKAILRQLKRQSTIAVERPSPRVGTRMNQ